MPVMRIPTADVQGREDRKLSVVWAEGVKWFLGKQMLASHRHVARLIGI